MHERHKQQIKAVAISVIFMVLGMGLFVLPARTHAAINQQINFQGKLTNPDGTNVANGSYSIRFRIYTDPTLDAANACVANSCKWEDTESITVSDGIFNYALGSNGSYPLPGSVDFTQAGLYIGIKVGSDPEMTPRVQFTAAPYAFNSLNSEKLGNIASSGFVQLGQVSGATGQTDASTNSSIFVNKTNTGNIVQLQSSAVDVMTISNAGDLAFGQNANHTISVAQESTNAAGNSLTVSAGQGGAGASVNDGGVLALQGGAGGGTNGNGGNLTLAGGAGNGTGAAGSVIVKNPTDSTTAFQVQNAGGTTIFNVDTTNKQIAVTGGVTINTADNSIVRTSSADFALGTVGASLVNSSAPSGQLEISDGIIPNSGNGTITNTGQPAVNAVVAAGASAVTRPDGKYQIFRGGGTNATSIYDAYAGTITNSVTLSANVGAGSTALPRPNGMYLVLHGNGSTTTTNFDPSGTVATSAGPALGTAAGAGTVALKRADGKYLIALGASAGATSVYDPTANTFTVGPTNSGAVNWGVGALALNRPDGTALFVTGGVTSTTQIYNPNTATTYIGAFPSVGPSLDGSSAAGTCGINGAGSVALRRADGKFVIVSKANVSTVYDPVSNTMTCRSANGPASALGDGAHAIPLQNGKFLIIRGGITTTSFIYDPTADTFTTHGSSLSLVGAGAFSLMRPDGYWQIFNGNSTTTTNNYDTGLPMNGTTTKYTMDDISSTALNASSTLKWTAQNESVFVGTNGSTNTAFSNMQFFVRTAANGGDCTTSLNAATDREIQSSGDFIRPTSGDTCIRVTVQFNRPIPKRITDDRGTWTGNNSTVHRLDYATPTLFDLAIDNSTVLHRDNFSFTAPTAQGENNGTIPTTPSSTGPSAGGSCTAGAHFWYVTNVTNGSESRLSSSYTASCTGPLGTLPLTFATGPTGTTARKIYRTKAAALTTDTPYLVTTINNNTATTFSDTLADGSLGAAYSAYETSGPTATRAEAVNNQLTLPFGRIATSGTTIGTSGYYPGVMSGGHPVSAQTNTDGTVVITRPDKRFIILSSGGAITTNTQMYDPATQTLTTQTGVNATTATTGSGAFAVKRPDGKFLVVLGGATTVTNIYDPNTNVFSVGPALTVAAGAGAFAIPNNDGTFTLVHGNGTTSTSMYDPNRNTMNVGPVSPTTAFNCGALAIPRPGSSQYFVLFGSAAGVAGPTTSSYYDANAKNFSATARAPALSATQAVGCGAFAFQRQDGIWVIVEGGGGTAGAAQTATMLYEPRASQLAVGFALPTGVRYGAHVIPRADGTFLIVNGNATTATQLYIPVGGTAAGTIGVPTGMFITGGPALTAAAGAGALSFQRPDGKWVTVLGNTTTTMNTYDAGWYADGQYLSEQTQVPALVANSVLNWRQTSENFVRMEVRYASSQAALATTAYSTVGKPGGSIGNAGGETWVQVEVNLRRDFPTFGGPLNGVYVSTGGMAFQYRTITQPTIISYDINNGGDVLTLQSNGLNVMRVTSEGNVYSSSTGGFYSGGADLAENYTSTDSLLAGEVVSIDPANNHGVKRSSGQYQSSVLGVVSTAPGFVAGSFTADSYPIALVGRVPVKISSENGPVKEGDFLTAASIPGYAMKATVSGRVIGTALEAFDPANATACPVEGSGVLETTQCGSVMMFVNLTNYQGESVESMMTADADGQLSGDAYVPNLDFPDVNGLVGEKQASILAFLQRLKARQAAGLAPKGSDITANRVVAVDEVISPVMVADIIRAKTIQATKIEGLELFTDKISSLSLKYDGLKTQVSQTGTATTPSLNATAVTFGGTSSGVSLISLGKIEAKGGLVVDGETQFNGKTTFMTLAQFVDKVVLSGDVSADGRVTFNNDTGGSAVIVKNGTRVEVKFAKEYAENPIVSAQLLAVRATLPNGTKEPATEAEQRLLAAGYSYVISSVDTKGFTIVLNKKAAENLHFNWQAIAVKDVRTDSGDVDPEAATANSLGESTNDGN